MHSHLPRRLLIPLLLLLALPLGLQASEFQQRVQQLLPDIGEMFGTLPDGQTIYGKFFINRMYQQHGFRPLWSDKAIRALNQALNGLEADGLTPADYRFETIAGQLAAPSIGRLPPDQAALADILLSEAYLRALYHLYYGKVDPKRLDADNNFGQQREGRDRSQVFLEWIKGAHIEEAFNWARPDNERYRMLKRGLAQYRQLQAAGGWPSIPKGDTIKPGASDPRIAQIRKRLAITKEMASAAGPSTLDAGLIAGVKRFQEHHGLETDGAIGAGTLAAMNVPVQDRIDQIRVNLERQRWVLHEDKGEFLAVDIPGFMIYWVKDKQMVWKEQVQVGKAYTSTPVFKDEIEYIVFNPTWTIPPGILSRSTLPSLKKDPRYLDKMGYELLSKDGQPVDPLSVDWKSLSSFPYSVRQAPGNDNALGLVKFMFPNKHHVFLHDTNHRELFAKQVRTTSSGCIRVRNPFDLAERILSRQGWDRARIDKVVASGKSANVKLEKPLRILILYNTARWEDAGVSFKDDIYKRDPAILTALNGPFMFHKQDLESKLLTGAKPAGNTGAGGGGKPGFEL